MAGTSGSKTRQAGAAGMAGRFGPRRLAAFRALWTLLRQARRPGAPGVGDMLRAFPRMAGAAVTGRYPGLTGSRLFVFVLAAVYLVSPVDLVPEIVFNVFGLVDDAVVALWLGGAVLVETDRFLHWERTDGSREGNYDGIVDGEVVGEAR